MANEEVVKVPRPARFKVAVPRLVVESKNVTVPAGVPSEEDTVAVREIGVPGIWEFSEDDRATEEERRVIEILLEAEVEPEWLMSPA